MRKILWIKIKEPYEKLAETIINARENKEKIEISNYQISNKLNKKQSRKFLDWMEENKYWLENNSYTETELERLQRQIPGLWCSATVDLSNQKKYFVFDFS